MLSTHWKAKLGIKSTNLYWTDVSEFPSAGAHGGINLDGPTDLEFLPSEHLLNYTNLHNSVNGWQLMRYLFKGICIYS